MKRHVTTLIIVVGCLVLALDVVTLGYAFTRGGGFQLAKFPGRIAVRDGCGLQHMWLDPSLRNNVRFGYYPSGHMVYLNPEAQKTMKADVAKFYDDALAKR